MVDINTQLLKMEPTTTTVEVQPHCLSETSLLLYQLKDAKEPPVKPPPTPCELISDCFVTILPKIPETANDIEIPFVRQLGIRDSIQSLASYFDCQDYKHNLVQFWLLDILVDCIWRMQDEFSFGIRQQKCALEWLLFVLRLIADQKVSKQLLFEVFEEAMELAEEYIHAGGLNEPIPDKLFTLQLNKSQGELGSASSKSGTSSKSSLKDKPSGEIVVIKYAEECQVFKIIPTKMQADCLSSSVDSASERGLEAIEEETPSIAESSKSSESTVEFYKADMKTPPRFKSIDKLNKESSVAISLDISQDSSDTVKSKGDWHNIPRKRLPTFCSSKLVLEKSSISAVEEKTEIDNGEDSAQLSTDIFLTHDEILKIFYNYNLWKLQNEFMADSATGWASLKSHQNQSNSLDNKEKANLKTRSTRIDNQAFINSCVLMVVRQMVIDYFAPDFAFELARISLTTPQFFITQDINTEWNIPKEIKGELKKPIPKKPKKEKPKKERKPKKDKSSKSKSSKGSKKSKDKKSAKGKDKKKSKKDKKSSGKSSKSDKKGSKIDKKEQERLRKEQEELEKELVRQAENKMYMFPLKEAVNEEFFARLFPNFKAKKETKSKSPKRDKSSKGSKKGDKKRKK